MTTPTHSPAPAKRSRRMIVWMVVLPAVFLLFAFAAANWRVFHLAYCKRLMGSQDPGRRYSGLARVAEVHLLKGMTEEEVKSMISPLTFEGERGANSSGFSLKALRSTKGSGLDRTESAVVFYFNATGHLTRVSLEITGHPGAVMPATTDYELGEARH